MTLLGGIPFKNGNLVLTSQFLYYCPIQSVMAKQGILFLDKITSALPTVSTAVYQLILNRCLGDYIVSVIFTYLKL
ncbi:MAG: hypothetical protein H0A74_01300 [Candidatus Vesicomyosocius endoextente]|uniref:Uncharacterized protein n=1 Tax=Candidatus Vesicomyosocius endoextente TaxID=2738853 RepID=A0A853GBH0_9GAMM|nr:hypothetical protein [Candidatus Vesicomyosocius endoextente]